MRSGGAVVLASGVNVVLIFHTLDVLRQGILVEYGKTLGPHARHEPLNDLARSPVDEGFGERSLLDQEVPVKVGLWEHGVCAVVHCQGRAYVEEDGLADACWMVDEELMSDTGTAIMATDVKGLIGIAKGVHDGDAVVGHVALGIESSVVGGLGRRAIAANVHYNKGEVRRELRCDGVPHVVRLWVSVQQKKRREGRR